jgi:MFS family permease
MTEAGPENSTPVSKAAVYGLVLLTVVNMLNYVDRYVVGALVESLKESELALTDTQVGWLMSGFIIIYTFISALFGYLGDRGRRTTLIATGVGIWSLATGMAGFARSFGALFVARSCVGIGEAAYGTIAPAVISDYFPRERRGRVLAIFFMAIPVGSALGYVLGGLIDKHYGWRAAFFIVGFPGLLFSLLVWLLPDPKRGHHDIEVHSEDNKEQNFVEAYVGLFKNRVYLLAVMGYAAYTFALGGLALWMPAFLERIRGVPREDATMQFGAIIVVTGFIGTFVGGSLGDRLLKKYDQAYLWVSGVATLLAVPFATIALVVPSKAVYLPALVVAELLIFVSTGPINSAILNVVAPGIRAKAVALSILLMHLFGDVPSPPLIGAISEYSDLASAVLVVPVAIFISGAIWTYAAWRPAPTWGT